MVRKDRQERPSARLIDGLYHFQFHDAKGQAVVYLATATIVLAYAVVNGMVLRRPEQNVVLECAFLTACLLVCLTFLCGSGLTRGIASYVRRIPTLSLVLFGEHLSLLTLSAITVGAMGVVCFFSFLLGGSMEGGGRAVFFAFLAFESVVILLVILFGFLLHGIRVASSRKKRSSAGKIPTSISHNAPE